MSGAAGALIAFLWGVTLLLTYAVGLPGVWISAFLLLGGILVSGVMAWADAAMLVLQSFGSIAVLWFAGRFSLRHDAWRARIVRDRQQAKEKQSDVENLVQQLRDKIGSRATDVEKGLKQYELVKRLSEAMSFEEMVPGVEKALKYFFRSEAWALYLTDSEAKLEMVQRRGAIGDPQKADLQKKEAFLYTFVPATGMNTGQTVWGMGLPLWRVHEFIGVLLVRLPDMEADQRSVVLSEAQSFSVQLIFAMAKAKLFRELQVRSRTDGLTGLMRRGPFEERLKEEFARARSFKTTFSLLMIDIDHFKRMNDTYGHQIGDEVLRTVSQRLKEGLYETDVIARYGGEEFVCLLPRSIAAGLRVKADRIRQSIEAHAFVIGLESVTVTISIGIAHFPQDGDTPQAVLAAADRALYAAKGNGRNQVMEASTLPK